MPEHPEDCTEKCHRCDVLVATDHACEDCADKYEQGSRKHDEMFCECCFDDLFVPWPKHLLPLLMIVNGSLLFGFALDCVGRAI